MRSGISPKEAELNQPAPDAILVYVGELLSLQES